MKILLTIFMIVTFLFPNEIDTTLTLENQETIFQEHISLIVHESLINTFFQNMGDIQGKGTSSVVDYTWHLLNPRVEIEEKGASFLGKVLTVIGRPSSISLFAKISTSSAKFEDMFSNSRLQTVKKAQHFDKNS